MQTSMAVTALFMGFVGGPHCVAMCGAACAGIAKAAAPRTRQAIVGFQLGRIVGYATLGGVAAATVQGLGWLGTNTVVLRPLWTAFHVLALLLGLLLLLQARQPAWVDGFAQTVWRKAKPVLGRLGGKAPYALGAGWALMPCGLLYSALLLASLSANVFEGAAIMGLFALGTSVSMTVGPWLLLRWHASGSLRGGAWGMRLAGAALVLTSGWAIWMGLTNPTGLWCA